MNTKRLSTLDAILDSYKTILGKDYDGYRNHCHRTYFICEHLNGGLDDTESEKLQIALAFHDIGLFTDNTVDYLPPSERLAKDYLAENDLSGWSEEVGLLITEHHKIMPFKQVAYPLVEVMRKADLVDFSLGIVKHGMDKAVMKQLKKQFPNAGFHKMLTVRQLGWLKSHPTNPFPIFKV